MKQFFEKKFLDVIKPNYILFIILGVFIDLSTKFWIIQNYGVDKEKEIDEFFRITLVFNTGFIFGVYPDNMILSIFSTSIAILFLLVYRLKNPALGNPWGWNLVLIGAFGNLIDKFFIKMPPGHGVKLGLFANQNNPDIKEYIGVVDFLDFNWPDYLIFQRWPAFNFADSCVSIGLVILILTMNFI